MGTIGRETQDTGRQDWHCSPLPNGVSRTVHHPMGSGGGRSGCLKGHGDRTGVLQGGARSGTHGGVGSSGGQGGSRSSGSHGEAGSSGGHGGSRDSLARPHRPWLYSPPKKNYWGDLSLGGALEAQTLGGAVEEWAQEGAVEERAQGLGEPRPAGLPYSLPVRKSRGRRRACVGHERRWVRKSREQRQACGRRERQRACGSCERWRAGSGSGPDTPQTPENTFPATQSGGVWEVHRTVVVGPEPEQFIKGGVIPRRRRGKLAELPGELIEGEPLMG